MRTATLAILLGLMASLFPLCVMAQDAPTPLQQCEQQVVAQGVSNDTGDFMNAVGSNLDPRMKQGLLDASAASHRFDTLSLAGRINLVTCLVKARDFADAKPLMDALAATPGAPARIFFGQAAIDYQLGDTPEALAAAEHGFVLDPEDENINRFLQSRFAVEFERDRSKLVAESHDDPEYAYWSGLSPDERQIIEARGGKPYANKTARPCHVSYANSGSFQQEMWYYCNEYDTAHPYSTVYTFTNGKLTLTFSP